MSPFIKQLSNNWLVLLHLDVSFILQPLTPTHEDRLQSGADHLRVNIYLKLMDQDDPHVVHVESG